MNPERPYTPQQISELEHYYTPAQLEAILAGEQVISREDFARRQPRNGFDPFQLRYVDDLSKIDPILDFPQGEYKPVLGHPQQPLPEVEDPTLKFPDDEASGFYRGEDLTRITGFSVAQLKRFMVRKMVFHRVVNQTRMGKVQRFYALHIAGNGNGLLGIGEGKSAEPSDAAQIATYMALRNVEPIPRYEGRTIYGKVKVKMGAVELELRTAPPGYGVRASEPIFEMCRCLGITDLSAKITRSRNRMNVVKAVMEGLRNQKLPDTIARGRGIKLADVRRVYYNGSNMGLPSSYL
ncbi:ribosomal protein S5, C-terminal domain-containing protein [Kalaharituber pfeilii]|nr:ribosomal protein S5, C-terminal domain-containing protein [Kalaharituber pfeilii]